MPLPLYKCRQHILDVIYCTGNYEISYIFNQDTILGKVSVHITPEITFFFRKKSINVSMSFFCKGNVICGPLYVFSGPVMPSSAISSDSSENFESKAPDVRINGLRKTRRKRTIDRRSGIQKCLAYILRGNSFTNRLTKILMCSLN